MEASQTPKLLVHLEQEHIEFFVAYSGELEQDDRFEVIRLPAEPAALYCRPEHPLLQQNTPRHRRRYRASHGPPLCSTNLSPRVYARCSA
uniref:hypothetical protein n=1 Tax=Pseudomonas sp. WP18 TaxID=3118752 RepID=UPI00403FB6DB